MRKTETLSPARVKELFSYGQDGKVVWKVTRNGRVKAGQAAGSPLETGHLRVTVDGQQYMVGRIAYCLVTGEWPLGLLEHIDGDKANCKFSNLRVITPQERATKAKRNSANNSTGYTGVFWRKELGKWYARLGVGGKFKHLGHFTCPEQASRAHQQAKAAILAAYEGKE